MSEWVVAYDNPGRLSGAEEETERMAHKALIPNM
jgi:hypothetical protein